MIHLQANSPASCEKGTLFRQGSLWSKPRDYHFHRLARARSMPCPAPRTNQFQFLTTAIRLTQTLPGRN
jgi:hypothetical protein